MVLRRTATLCTVLLMMLSAAVCPVYSMDSPSGRDVSDNLPFSLAATSEDKMYFLPVYDGTPATDSFRQLVAVLSGVSFDNECISQEFTEVIFSEISVTELRLVESISPRAP